MRFYGGVDGGEEKMKVITERDLIRLAPKRWRDIYADGRHGEDKLEILKKLEALNTETATAKEISDIIGNDSWVKRLCSECGCYKTPVIEVGEEPDYESSTATLCRPCLEKAYSLMKKVKP